jgi:hypothetical protein
MARARNIKPGFFKNEELAECDPLARILFAGLWTIADKEGRMEYRPKRIKAEILPYDDCEIDALIYQLTEHGFIILYEVDNAQYLEIPTFLDHQNPHKNEPESKIPECSEDSGANIIQRQSKDSPNPAESLNPITESLIIENGKRDSRTCTRKKPDNRIQYAEFVKMTQIEHGKLVEQYGEEMTDRFIQKLDNHKGASGRTYKSDYRAILSWVIDAVLPKNIPKKNDPASAIDELIRGYECG